MTHVTQPYFLKSPLIDASAALELLLLRFCINVSTAARLASTDNLPGVRLIATDSALFRIYHSWVHHNPGTHLDASINKDCKWQAR